MSKTLYITAAGPHSGKSAIALGVMQLLSTQTSKIAVFRPIIAQPEFDKKDSAINLFLEYFKLEQNYCDTFAYTEDEAYDIINRDSKSALEESILKKFKALEAKYDFVLCLGTDFRGKDAAFEFELNADIAGNIGAPVLLVVSGKDKNLPELRQIIHMSMETMTSHCDLVTTVINRSNLSNAELSGFAAASPAMANRPSSTPFPRIRLSAARRSATWPAPSTPNSSAVPNIPRCWSPISSSPPCMWITSFPTWKRIS